jgi:hypothetical protein
MDPEDVADAGRYLDRIDDGRFAVYGLDPGDVARLRARLREWPR